MTAIKTNKVTEIYKNDKLISKYNNGWMVYKEEIPFIYNFIKTNKDNIYKVEVLEKIVRKERFFNLFKRRWC